MAEAIKLRTQAHSFEGKVFSVVATSTISEEIIKTMEQIRPDARELLERPSSAYSGIIGPDGRNVGTELIDEEGIAYGEIDLARCIQPKQMHDIVGHYQRFDVFNLSVDHSVREPVSQISPAAAPSFAPLKETPDDEI
jgi:aliphatic nitrilase